MYTRQQYIKNECTHEQYYEQFISAEDINYVERLLGDKIRASTDPHFNDIPLACFDSLRFVGKFKLLQNVGDFLTMAGNVCIGKAIARLIKAKKEV